MRDKNKVFLTGRLTRDPKSNKTKSGKDVTNFSIAVSRKLKEKERTEFISIECFGVIATTCSKYLKKGRKVLAEGSLRQDKWEKDGVKHSNLVVLAEDVTFLDYPVEKQQSENLVNDNDSDSEEGF